MADRDYSAATIKTLFALSGNTCAFQDERGRGCEEKLTDPSWVQVKAVICHIAAASPGGPRYDESMTDAERNGFDNLLLMCPNHSREIDYLRPDDFTAERLREMKLRHDERGTELDAERETWATVADIERFAVQLIAWTSAAPGATVDIASSDDASASESESITIEIDGVPITTTIPEPTIARGRPSLSARVDGEGVLWAVNRGGGHAYSITLEPSTDDTVDAWNGTLAPREEARVGRPTARGMLQRLRWADADGDTYTTTVNLSAQPRPGSFA